MHRYNESKMYTNLSGFFKGAGMQSSLRALGFMREKHGHKDELTDSYSLYTH